MGSRWSKRNKEKDQDKERQDGQQKEKAEETKQLMVKPEKTSQYKYRELRERERAAMIVFLSGLHERLGAECPLGLVGPYVVRDIVELVMPKHGSFVVNDHRTFKESSHFRTENEGTTLVQITDCINVIAASLPPLETGQRVFWTLTIKEITPSGSMRYMGVHDEVEGFWSPRWSVNLQTGVLMRERAEVEGAGATEMHANTAGDRCSVLIDLSDEKADGKGRIAFFFNGKRIRKQLWDFEDVPLGKPLWLAVTLQRANDSLVQSDEIPDLDFL